jgi:folate-dependent phosphoribosylglycinamide formyltransferase PurN
MRVTDLASARIGVGFNRRIGLAASGLGGLRQFLPCVTARDDAFAAHFWTRMKTALICHDGALLEQHVMPRWLGSFSDVVGIIVLRETKQRERQRVRRELQRVGFLRFLDVSLFRLYYKVALARADAEWEEAQITRLKLEFAEVNVPILVTHSPNSPEAERFLKECQPDLMVARCKVILNKRIFSIPAKGTFVMHPGICPEYRNAHGCFWALVRRDFDRVGMTLLRVDAGVDTGNIFGYFTYAYDSLKESHVRIQNRVVWDNLKPIAELLQSLHAGTATAIEVAGRESNVWGHPWLTRYVQWKRRARLHGR